MEAFVLFDVRNEFTRFTGNGASGETKLLIDSFFKLFFKNIQQKLSECK